MRVGQLRQAKPLPPPSPHHSCGMCKPWRPRVWQKCENCPLPDMWMCWPEGAQETRRLRRLRCPDKDSSGKTRTQR